MSFFEARPVGARGAAHGQTPSTARYVPRRRHAWRPQEAARLQREGHLPMVLYSATPRYDAPACPRREAQFFHWPFGRSSSAVHRHWLRARFREPHLEDQCGRWPLLPSPTVDNDNRGRFNHDFSDDGDALMGSGGSQTTGNGTDHVPNNSWRPPGHDYQHTTTTGADRASSAGTDPSSGT